MKWAARFLFAAGILTLAWCGFVLADAWLYQSREVRQLDDDVLARQLQPVGLPVRPAATRVLAGNAGLFGKVEIPRLGISVIVTEGVDSRTLRRAAGHIPGTGMPGQTGNIGISAHRDTFFRPLRNVVPGDMVTLATPAGDFRYKVVSTQIVPPSDVSVLAPDGEEVLTLVTCYPFYFVGPAPDRFIVRAERVI